MMNPPGDVQTRLAEPLPIPQQKKQHQQGHEEQDRTVGKCSPWSISPSRRHRFVRADERRRQDCSAGPATMRRGAPQPEAGGQPAGCRNAALLRLSQPARVADEYVDLPDILLGFDPTACGLEDAAFTTIEPTPSRNNATTAQANATFSSQSRFAEPCSPLRVLSPAVIAQPRQVDRSTGRGPFRAGRESMVATI